MRHLGWSRMTEKVCCFSLCSASSKSVTYFLLLYSYQIRWFAEWINKCALICLACIELDSLIWELENMVLIPRHLFMNQKRIFVNTVIISFTFFSLDRTVHTLGGQLLEITNGGLYNRECCHVLHRHVYFLFGFINLQIYVYFSN